MILISHRGNIDGSNIDRENSPYYIMEAIQSGYNVEIDVWMIKSQLFLGHDEPRYKIDITWINDRCHVLWIHCKNIDALKFFNNHSYDINYFWHEKDKAALTSKRFIWAYPGNQPIDNSIAVLPELNNENVSSCIGICSDYIKKYK